MSFPRRREPRLCNKAEALEKHHPSQLSLWQRALCILLAYVFLIGPESFQFLSEAAVQYDQISTLAWAKGSTSTDYDYDENGSLTLKVTKDGSQIKERVEYEYNFQNRLSKVTTTPYSGGNPGTSVVVEYRYNPAGIRIRKITDGTTEIQYLVDPANHTGYAQVLEESTLDITIPESPVLQGVMLSDNSRPESSAQTTHLYAGEQFDTSIDNYYLRARYYNQSSGTFNRFDPYAGNKQDPQSLHKYLYVHNNPINPIDPSGMYIFTAVLIPILKYALFVTLMYFLIMPYVRMAQAHAYLKIRTKGQWFSRRTRIKSGDEFIGALKKIVQDDKKIIYFEYVGHGSGEDDGSDQMKGYGLIIGEGGIYTRMKETVWATESSPGMYYIEDMENLIKDAFDPKAVIELKGCFTAFDRNSIAYGFKKILPNATVKGFTGPTYLMPFIKDTKGRGGSVYIKIE